MEDSQIGVAKGILPGHGSGAGVATVPGPELALGVDLAGRFIVCQRADKGHRPANAYRPQPQLADLELLRWFAGFFRQDVEKRAIRDDLIDHERRWVGFDFRCAWLVRRDFEIEPFNGDSVDSPGRLKQP